MPSRDSKRGARDEEASSQAAWQSLLPRLAATVASASVAESVTFPVDCVKTRLQLQGEMQSGSNGPRLGALRMGMKIMNQEGLVGLYAGLHPALIRHIPYSGTRIMVFEYLRGAFADSTGQSGSPSSVAAKMGMGLIAGATGQAVAVPADLVKVRMQADGRLVAAGELAAPRYKGVFHALSTIVAQEGGVAALWRGASPAIQRAALVNLGELATYDLAKGRIVENGSLGDGKALSVHVASSVCSGLVAGLVSTPADVVKTRMMNQDPTKPIYRSSLDCLLKSFQAEGISGLYKGFLPTWARLGPWQLAFWVTYEQLRAVVGVGSF